MRVTMNFAFFEVSFLSKTPPITLAGTCVLKHPSPVPSPTPCLRGCCSGGAARQHPVTVEQEGA